MSKSKKPASFNPLGLIITGSKFNPFRERISPLHNALDAKPQQDLVRNVWRDKYIQAEELIFQDPTETAIRRVVAHVYKDDTEAAAAEAYYAMEARLFLPGGCVLANAGTPVSTLMNCFVNHTVEDDFDEIANCLHDAATTLRKRGGVGTDFSTIRPKGAFCASASEASGPLAFMEMFQTMSLALSRRGQMGTLIDTHPDLPDFIIAKQSHGKLTSFNLSILVSDAFMAAVQDDEEWLLYFNVPRAGDLLQETFVDSKGVTQYVYSTWRARELWDLITRNTYEWSEPGIIFIDRINDWNNLKYIEDIRCTNPCGEQPLPPNGACDLGSINAARLVLDPFTSKARPNWQLLKDMARIGMRFLDNVIDASEYPLEPQRLEQVRKRRTGLNFTGVADFLAQLGLRYGSPAANEMTERLSRELCIASYQASIDLARARGKFPYFNADKYLDDTFVDRMLPDALKQEIRRDGIRNSVLLTSAPTGSISIVMGNISSGYEPNFAHKVKRFVKDGGHADSATSEYFTYSYLSLLYAEFEGLDVNKVELPSYCVTAKDLTVAEHVMVQAAAQRWIDASISKTVNVPKDMPFEEFKEVYNLAYASGCKGCTTYRPSDVRGAILVDADAGVTAHTEQAALSTNVNVCEPILLDRDETLIGVTHKIKWPSLASAVYVTVNKTKDGHPFEVFFNSKDSRHQEWMTALSLMISAILRKGGDVSFIADELTSIQSVNDAAWIKPEGGERPKFFGSIIAYIGYILGNDFQSSAPLNTLITQVPADSPVSNIHMPQMGEKCPKCLAPAMEHKEGCKICANCGYSTCY